MTNCEKSVFLRILGLTMALVLVLSVFYVVPVASEIVSVAESLDYATQVAYKPNDANRRVPNPYQEWYFETAGEAYCGIAYTPAAKDSYAKWKVEQVGDFYRFVNQGNNKALAQNGTTLNLVSSSDSDDYQLWEVRKSENFTGFSGLTMTVYNFLNKATGKVLRSDASYLGRHPYLTTMPDVAFWPAAEVLISFTDTVGNTTDLATDTELLIRIGNPAHTNYFTAITNYRIKNRVSGKFLTVKDDTLETYATQMTDASQLWQLRPTLSPSQPDYLNLYNVESGNYLGFDGSNILWDLHSRAGETLLSLNGNTSIKIPQDGVAYRINPISWKGNVALSEYVPMTAIENPEVNFSETITGFDAQIWKFIVNENIPGTYYIQNKASGNYLTLDPDDGKKVKTAEYLHGDYRQLWTVDDTKTNHSDINSTHIAIKSFCLNQYLYYWNEDKLAYCDGYCSNANGEACLQLNGIKQTPENGKYYRINLRREQTSTPHSLTETGHTYTPIYASVNWIESAPAINRISSNWILKAETYEGETVYTIKNKDLGLVINKDYGLSYEEPGHTTQYFRFIETSEKTYKIQNVFTNAILVWAGGNGSTPGKQLSGAAADKDYTWQLISETGSVSVCEGTFMICGQGGTMRATGGADDSTSSLGKLLAVSENDELFESSTVAVNNYYLWKFISIGNYWLIKNSFSDLYLTMNDGIIYTAPYDGANNYQLWKITDISSLYGKNNGIYEIQCYDTQKSINTIDDKLDFSDVSDKSNAGGRGFTFGSDRELKELKNGMICPINSYQWGSNGNYYLSCNKRVWGDINSDSKRNLCDLVCFKKAIANNNALAASFDLDANGIAGVGNDIVILRMALLGADINEYLQKVGDENEFTNKIGCIYPKNGEEICVSSNQVEELSDDFEIYDSEKYAFSGELCTGKTINLSWDNTDEKPLYYTVYISSDSAFEKGTKYIVDDTSLSLPFLYTATKYYWRISAHYENKTKYSDTFSFNVKFTPRTLSVDGVSNIRDIGGYMTESGVRIKQGLVYRSAYLDEISEIGRKSMLTELMIKTDLDLRRNGEGTAGQYSPLGSSVNYKNISGPYYTGGNGIDNVSNQAALANEIRLFADKNNYPVVFHCSVGRDRTGTLAFLLGGLLGMKKEDLFLDYEMSFLSVRGCLDKQSVKTMVGQFTNLYNYIESYNGKDSKPLSSHIESFLKDIGITDTEISAIRSILLENS